MNSLENIPVLISPRNDGSYEAECLMVPGCVCYGRTRQQALETMQSLVQRAVREDRVREARYEIVYLAVPARSPTSPRPNAPTRPS